MVAVEELTDQDLGLVISDAFLGASKVTKNLIMFIEIALDSKTNPLIWGPPGVGKTAIINAVAQKRNMLLRTLLGSTMDPTDVAGLPLLRPSVDGSMPVTEFAIPEWFYEVSEYALAHPESGAIIFIDEITTAPPPVQAALLTFVQDRRIGKFFLPDNVLIIAAGNPPEQAADGNILAPPTANRFSHYYYEPSKADWFAGMRIAWNSKRVSERELRQRALVVSFLTENKTLINKMPTDPEEAGKAWPSMRSWDNAAKMLGKAEPNTIQSRILESNVGKEAADQFMEWAKSLMLPDYDDLMNDPESFDWSVLRADALYLTLSMVVDRVTFENAEQSRNVFYAAKAANKDDVVGSLVTALKSQTFKAYEAAGQNAEPLRTVFIHFAHDIYGKLLQLNR